MHAFILRTFTKLPSFLYMCGVNVSAMCSMHHPITLQLWQKSTSLGGVQKLSEDLHLTATFNFQASL